MPLAPDTRLGPDRVLEQLVEGGMGEVYRATVPTGNASPAPIVVVVNWQTGLAER